MKIKLKQAGLALGAVFGLMHLTWVILVALFGTGIAQYITGLHFITAGIATMPVNAGTAVLGVVTAFIAGWIIGAVFSLIWNAIDKK